MIEWLVSHCSEIDTKYMQNDFYNLNDSMWKRAMATVNLHGFSMCIKIKSKENSNYFHAGLKEILVQYKSTYNCSMIS